MRKTELATIDYEQLEMEIIDKLSYRNDIVLATSFYNDVRAGIINYINDNLNIYFIETLGSVKLKHMEANNKVAFVLNNLEIDATIEILGNPANNKWFSEMYKVKFSETFSKQSKKYSKKHCLVKANIERATLYENDCDISIKKVLEIGLMTAYKFKIY